SSPERLRWKARPLGYNGPTKPHERASARNGSGCHMPRGFFFDNTRCTGCRTCVLACKDYRNLDAERTFRRVIDYEGGTWEQGADGTWEQDAFAYPSCPATTATAPSARRCARRAPCTKTIWGWSGPTCTSTAALLHHGVPMPPHDEDLKRSSKCDGCRERVAEARLICVEAAPFARSISATPSSD
ncbi:MAG: hypothetical protein ACLSVD_18330, partial [Eggerthellaceae bacterium]